LEQKQQGRPLLWYLYIYNKRINYRCTNKEKKRKKGEKEKKQKENKAELAQKRKEVGESIPFGSTHLMCL
jgi:hypothetical protein